MLQPVCVVAAAIAAFTTLACSSSSNGKAPATASTQSPARLEVIDRLDEATTLMGEFRGKLPDFATKGARCVVVVPSMMKGGLILGARHGEGFALCRAFAEGGTTQHWSAPAPISVSGGSAGLQVGVESVDLLMLVESDSGMKKLLSSKFEVGADVSASAGPVGRGRQVGTDTTMKSEVFAYTRSRGLFAGAELSGAVVKQDREATAALYREDKDFRTLLSTEATPDVDASRHFVEAVHEIIR